MKYKVMHGDCVELMGQVCGDDSIDAIVTDPPYGLRFMGKDFDNLGVGVQQREWHRRWAEEAFRVLKPGGHLLAFGGTRTYHHLATAIEDAGFEIRDMIQWNYGSGFPKSANVSKQIDKQENNGWLDVVKACDNISIDEVLHTWKKHSKSAKPAELLFQRNQTEVGTSMQKSGSAPNSVLLSVNPENLNANVIIAELSSKEAHLIDEEHWYSVLLPAEKSTTELSALVTTAGHSRGSPEATQDTTDSFVQCAALDCQGESTVDRLKGDEALRIWFGEQKSSRKATTSALSAALTDDLKVIILNQSKTFLNLDMKSQMECVSATTVTTTESMAAHLISFTVATLRKKAIDKAAGAGREIIRVESTVPGRNPENWVKTKEHKKGNSHPGSGYEPIRVVTAPATSEAQQWDGWGTALKPANEPIVLARKPLSEKTVAANVLKHGTGGINAAVIIPR